MIKSKSFSPKYFSQLYFVLHVTSRLIPMHRPLLQEKLIQKLSQSLKNEPEKIKRGSTFTPVTELFRQDSWGRVFRWVLFVGVGWMFFFFNLLFAAWGFSRVFPLCKHKICRWALSSPASLGVLEETTKCWESKCSAPELPAGHSLDLAVT